MTVFDDEYRMVLNYLHCKNFDISSVGTFFTSDGYSYLDNYNVSARDFIEMRRNGECLSVPRIPAKVFQYRFEKLQNFGYLHAFVVCPHAKWTPYYKDALSAAKNVLRNARRIDDEFFHVSVVNSKAFGIGSVLFANTLAKDFYHNRNSTSILADYSKRYAKSSLTVILTKDDTVFGKSNGYSAYKIRDTRLSTVELGDSVDTVKLDVFSDYIAGIIKRHDGRYAISFGYNCDFGGNIIGRIERLTKHAPLVSAQYGIATAELFGTNTICFHFGEYI